MSQRFVYFQGRGRIELKKGFADKKAEKDRIIGFNKVIRKIGILIINTGISQKFKEVTLETMLYLKHNIATHRD